MRTIPILLLRAFFDLFRSIESLEAERLALRQELANLKTLGAKRPQLRVSDRVFWVVLSQLWSEWRDALVTVQPETVQRWRRSGLRLIWPKRSGRQPIGRPRIAKENQQLIRWMSRDNTLWGAPRIHGELLKLGIDLSQTTVAKYMVRRSGGSSQTWRTFLRNHAREIIRHSSVNISKVSDFRLLHHRVRFTVRRMIDWILCGSSGGHSTSQRQVTLLSDKPLWALPRYINMGQRACFQSRGPPSVQTPLIIDSIKVTTGPRCESTAMFGVP
jgi:hypothetical protein